MLDVGHTRPRSLQRLGRERDRDRFTRMHNSPYRTNAKAIRLVKA